MLARPFEDVEAWMRHTDTQVQMRAWLAERNLTLAPRIAIAMVMLAGGHVSTDSPHDGVMQREAQRFVRTACAAMRDASAPLPDVDRARRFYSSWKNEDRDRLISHLTALAHSAAARGETPDEGIFESLAQVGGPADVVRASCTWARVRAPELPEHVAAIARRAFWDVVREGVAQGNFTAFFDVLDEMRSGMLALVAHHAHSADDLRDKLDVPWLRQRHANDALEFESIARLVLYLATTISGWQAPADADPTWLEQVQTRLADAGEGPPVFLVDFLAEAHEKLGQIYLRVVELSREA